MSIDEQPGRDRQVEILLGDDSPGVLDAILDTQRLIVFLIAGQCHHALGDVDADDTLSACLPEYAGEVSLTTRDINDLLSLQVADTLHERIRLDP